MDAATSRSTLLTRYWPLVKWTLFAIVLAFVGRRAYLLWTTSPSQSVHVNGTWLVLAGLAYLAGWLPSVWFWRALLRDMRQTLGWRTAIRAYYVGHMGKYIPGKALVLVIRGALVKDAGVNPLLAGVTTAYETLVFMAAGTALAMGLAPIAFGPALWSQLPAGFAWFHSRPILVPLIVAVATFATTPLSSWLFTLIGRKTIPRGAVSLEAPPSISAVLICQGLVVMSGGWMFHALSLGCVIQSVATQPFDIAGFPLWVAACSLSMVGGFVILIAPGGLGVREGLLIEVLKDQPQIGPAMALVVAGLLRVVWFVTELMTAAILYGLGPKTGRR
jgi:hypothetical protein